MRVGGGNYVSQYNSDAPMNEIINTYQTLLRGDNFMKLYDKTFFEIGYQQEISNGVLAELNLEVGSRLPLANYYETRMSDWDWTSNTPVNTELPQTDQFPSRYSQLSLRLKFNPGQEYISMPDRKILLDAKWPELELRHVQNVGDWSLAKTTVSVKDKLSLGLVGESKYKLRAGQVWRMSEHSFPDFFHFSTNQTLVAQWRKNDFQLLDYYTYSTRDRFLAAHFTHRFNGFIIRKIPLVRETKVKTVFAANYLDTPSLRNYVELGVGIENIFQFLRVDYYHGFNNAEMPNSGWRFSFGF